MKRIESRIVKLEKINCIDRFLVVIPEKGESREKAIKRSLYQQGFHEPKPSSSPFMIYLNLRGFASA
ncbi:MAG: hypothetical protein ABI597_04545 [Gammaproteobacteria bacterium]